MGSNTSKFFGLLLLSSMLQFSPSFAEDAAAATPADDKMYVTRRALRFVKNEIIVFNKEGAFSAHSLFSDENGLYVKKAELEKVRVVPSKKDRRGRGHWKKNKAGKGFHHVGEPKAHRMDLTRVRLLRAEKEAAAAKAQAAKAEAAPVIAP